MGGACLGDVNCRGLGGNGLARLPTMAHLLDLKRLIAYDTSLSQLPGVMY